MPVGSWRMVPGAGVDAGAGADADAGVGAGAGVEAEVEVEEAQTLAEGKGHESVLGGLASLPSKFAAQGRLGPLGLGVL
ncbi:hypothetical protein [Nocardiopsis sp. NPDC006832]|uniref:hypothetical protein n=1 Tax=Nocardiopsis sp. NPDC006832 TaxID=3157188 RepID=UPI0033CB7474